MITREKLILWANKFLARYHCSIVKDVDVNKIEKAEWIEEFFLKQTKSNQKHILLEDDLSKSQFKQDIFVLSELNFKSDGFFVEFGATNGVDLSNTYLLETEFGWNGILSEPAKGYQEQLKKNRNCAIERNCVWSQSGKELDFFEAKGGVLSTLNDFVESDFHKREKRRTYKVSTISLYDMLVKHNAPKIIDYLSIDTEGSEFEILQNFDFNQYTFKIITVEHNFKKEIREKIFDLLTKHNYVRKYIAISRADDWYVKSSPYHFV